MLTLELEIIDALEKSGIGCRPGTGCAYGVPSILCRHAVSGKEVRIVPLEIHLSTRKEALQRNGEVCSALGFFKEEDGEYPLIISRDRWERSRDMMLGRILAHLGIHSQIYARNCEVRRIDKPAAARFLAASHSYGDASCKYRYGLFVKRHTGHLLTEGHGDTLPAPGSLVAVSEFSGARRWKKGEAVISSYEWIRYASLPTLRVNGGMGKMLRHFIAQVHPDDIMSYADLEWSEGGVYEQLGFVCEGRKEPVGFVFDGSTWERRAETGQDDEGTAEEPLLRMMNFGSLKYRLKLTDYIDNY
ncbi:MAG: hypothetical protein ACI3ZL_00840 [Candidatus Cryptobacteroides sp.]